MYKLDQLNIPWDTVIYNETFTTPPSQHGQNTPSSSHPPASIPPSQPPASIPPSQPVVHTSLPSQIRSPHIEPSSSPFYNHTSSSHHDSESSSSEEDIEATWACFAEVEPFPKTYQRGYRHVFASLGVKEAMLSSSTQEVNKGKEKVIEPNIDDEEGNHETEQEF